MANELDDYYRKVSPLFDSLRLDGDAEISLTTSLIKASIDSFGGVSLEIGCGTGRYTRPLRYGGLSIIGLDLSFDQLSNAIDKRDLIQGNGNCLPFRSSSFLNCFAIMVVHQIPKEERSKLFAEVRRVLISQGTFIVKTCSHDDLRRRPFNQQFPTGLRMNLERYPDIKELERLLKRSGLEAVANIPMTTREFVSTDKLFNSLEKKHNTTLNLIPQGEFETGCLLLKEKYSNQTYVEIIHHHHLVIAK